MDAATIGKQIKASYPQYANVDDAELGNKYLQRFGGAISAIQGGQLSVEDIPQEQRVGVGVGLQAVGYQPETQSPAEVQKSKEEEQLIGQLEGLFFGTGDQESLAAAKQGFGGRIPGLFEKAKAKVSPGAPGSETERLNTYIRTLESIRPQLAKMAGDSGNIALAEQLQAGKGLPQPTDTPTEAIEIMQATRQKFGLGKSKELEAMKERVAKEQKKEENYKELEDRGFLEELFSVKGIKQYATEVPGMAIEGVVDTGKNVLDILKGDTQSAIERGRKWQGENEKIMALEKAAKAEISTKLGVYAALSSLKNYFGKKVANAFVKDPQATQQVLQRGVNQVNQGAALRDTAIQTADDAGVKIDGNKVYSSIQKAVERVKDGPITDAGKQNLDDFLANMERSVNGKQLTPSKLKDLWELADNGFTASGRAGNTIESEFHRVVRDVVRKELDDVTGGVFEQATSLIKGGLDEKKILKQVENALRKQAIKQEIGPSALGKFFKTTGGKVVGGAATGAGLLGIGKLLGVNLPGAAYTD